MIRMSDEYNDLLKKINKKYAFLSYELDLFNDKLVFSNLKKDLLYINNFDKYNVKDLEIIDTLLTEIFYKLDSFKNIYKNNEDLDEEKILSKVIEYYKKTIENKVKEKEFLLKGDNSLEQIEEYARLKDYLVYLEYIDSKDIYTKLSIIRDYEINQIENVKSMNKVNIKNYESVGNNSGKK